MKRSMIKIFSVLLIFAIVVGFSNSTFARDSMSTLDSTSGGGSSGSSGGSSLNPSIDLINPDTGGKTGQNTSKIVNIIVGTIQIIGVAAAIIMLVFLAIKYVSAAPSEKADIKKGAVIYIVGAVFLFGASVILGFVRDFITQIGG